MLYVSQSSHLSSHAVSWLPIHSNNRNVYWFHNISIDFKQVRQKDDKVTRLLDEYIKGSCVQGPCCLNCFSRYRISRDALNLLEEIKQLKGEQSQVSFIEQQPPKPVPESYKIVGKEISSNLDIARSYLADETVGMTFVWGIGL